MKITGNAFPQLSACNADGLQSHAGETSTMSMFKKNVDSHTGVFCLHSHADETLLMFFFAKSSVV